MKKLRKDTIQNLIKIINCLKKAENQWLWYRQIGRLCQIHHKTVSRLLANHLSIFIEEQSFEPFRVKMVRLKPDSEIDSIMRFLKIKEKINF